MITNPCTEVKFPPNHLRVQWMENRPFWSMEKGNYTDHGIQVYETASGECILFSLSEINQRLMPIPRTTREQSLRVLQGGWPTGDDTVSQILRAIVDSGWQGADDTIDCDRVQELLQPTWEKGDLPLTIWSRTQLIDWRPK